MAGLRPRVVPCRVEKIDKPTLRRRCHRSSPADERELPLSRRAAHRRAAKGRQAPQLLDRELAETGGRDHTRATCPSYPGGAFTDRVFSTLKVRDLLRFEGPLGTFYLREDSDKPIVMVASGTGFAPIKAMCEAAIQKGIKRPIALYWGCWTRRDMYMLGVPEPWQHSNLKFIPVLSNPTPECAWTGRTGFVHRAVMEDFPDLSGVQVYACGAPVMVEAARADFSAKCALPPEEFFADAFLTEADKAAA